MQLNTQKYDAFCSHIFHYACLRRKAKPPRRWYGNTNFSPLYLKVLPTPLAESTLPKRPVLRNTEALLSS